VVTFNLFSCVGFTVKARVWRLGVLTITEIRIPLIAFVLQGQVFKALFFH